jgi:hypothetical protein
MDKKKFLDQMMTRNGVDMRRANRAFKLVSRAVKLIYEIMPDIKATRLKKKSDFYSLAYWFATRIEDLAVADRASKSMAGDLLRKFAAMADQDYTDIKNGVKVDPSPTNQIFITLSKKASLLTIEKYDVELWEEKENENVIRVVTSFNTDLDSCKELIDDIISFNKL